MRAEHFECEPQGEFRAVGEHARAPVFRGERETPFGGAESGLERPDLKQADGGVGTSRNNHKADVLSGGTLAKRPRDELLEPVNCGRWRRDEARGLGGRHRRE